MANRVKTYFLLGGLTVILVLIGSFFGRSGMIVAFIFALLLNWLSYFFGDKIVLTMYKAQEVSYSQKPRLHQMVEQLCQKADLPKPMIYIIPSSTPNAFATGRDPRHASVAVTEGILNLLSEEELSGVLGHEITHIKDRDILVATIAATIAGAIIILARMLQWAAIFGGGDDNRGGNMIGFAGMLLFAILAPIAALIIQLAISRSREYLADDGGARLCGNPLFLANALGKLSRGVKSIPMRNVNPSTSHLFIITPFSGKKMLSLFSTHPPIEERIKRLEKMV